VPLWIESCVAVSPRIEAIRKYAEISGFPTTKVTEAKIMINPATAAGA
jgi:hypothetical protein